MQPYFTVAKTWKQSKCPFMDEWKKKIWHTYTHTHREMTIQFSSVAQSCPTPCNPMNRSTPGLPVHHQLPEFTQTHVHRVGDTIQPSHPLSSPSPPAPNPSQHQGLFQWVNSLHEVANVLKFGNLKAILIYTSIKNEYCVHTFPWKRPQQPAPLLLPEESHGQRNLAGTVHGIAQCLTWLKWLSMHACTRISITTVLFQKKCMVRRSLRFYNMKKWAYVCKNICNPKLECAVLANLDKENEVSLWGLLHVVSG